MAIAALVSMFVVVDAADAADETLYFNSGSKQTLLVELFTSQGCSSCPPAENWLRQLPQSLALWKDFVPVAFHVDYWDHLGWKDPYASSANTQRQYAYRKRGEIASVYTPCFVVNGREWKGFFARKSLRPSTRVTETLSVTVESDRVVAIYPQSAIPLDLHVAVLACGLQTKITRGENRNRRLTEDFVVVALEQHESNIGKWQFALPAFDKTIASRFALAFWVTSKRDSQPLQATGGWLRN